MIVVTIHTYRVFVGRNFAYSTSLASSSVTIALVRLVNNYVKFIHHVLVFIGLKNDVNTEVQR